MSPSTISSRLAALFVSVFAAASAVAADLSTSYDVVVYGATPAGVTAAVAAGREGKSAVLIEPLPLVGGMLSSGMGFSDSWLMHRETLGGLFREFRKRVEQDYLRRGVKLHYQVNNENGVPWTSESHVNERVFATMLREAGVRVLLNERLERIEHERASITALQTHSGKRLSGKVFIDASYEGDLLAAAGVDYRIGREAQAEFGESLAGVRYLKKPVDGVSALDDNGRPLPLITGTERPSEGQADRKIMSYSFRPCLTDEPRNRVPFGRPADYDPARYELFRRVYRAFPNYGVTKFWDQIPPSSSSVWSENGLPFAMFQIPGDKFDANNMGGQLSLGLPGASWAYPEADHEQRQTIWAEHRSYTEGLFYFLKTDAAVPARVRNRMQELGYCRDEFAEYGHFPPVLYVREGRRMVGAYFLTQADILERREKPDPIGIGSHLSDSHTVQRILTDNGRFVDEGMIGGPTIDIGVSWKDKENASVPMPFARPYQIPYRSILPKPEDGMNLLVPVALSASHVAFSSVRVEPTWMVLGESAGIAAAIAVEDQAPVQKVDMAKLMRRLEAKGQILKLPGAR